MQIVKIRNLEEMTVSERDYKSVALAQDTVANLLKKNQYAQLDVVTFDISPKNPAGVYSSVRLTKGEVYRENVLKNKIHREAVKEQREVGLWERANDRYVAAEIRNTAKAEKTAELAHAKELRELKQIAAWEKSNAIYHDRMTKRTLRELAEIEKWENYDKKAKENDVIVETV